MTKDQNSFFKELSRIQDVSVQMALCNKEKYGSMEEFATDVTGEVIIRLMELLDGYGNELPKCNIINSVIGEIMNQDIEFHDECIEFIEFYGICEGNSAD